MYHSSEISFIMHNFPCPSQTEHLEGSPTNYFSEFLFPLFSCFSICPPWRIMWPLLYCRSGQFLVWFISECGTAQLSLSLFFLFSCATADIVIDVDGLDNILPSWSSSTSTSMTMIFLTNQRPRKSVMTEWHLDIMTSNALRAAAVKSQMYKFSFYMKLSFFSNK